MSTILNHQLCQILKSGDKYRLLITMHSGEVVEHQPFPGDQRGLVAAMDVATSILAGKFWLSHSLTKKVERPALPEPVELKIRSKK